MWNGDDDDGVVDGVVVPLVAEKVSERDSMRERKLVFFSEKVASYTTMMMMNHL